MIIGAGVVGLAVGRAIAGRFENIFVVEKNDGFGQETSSRNSEVVHSGIYYPENSLKSSLCVGGRKLLYKYCDENNIPYKKTGKLVICHDSDDLVSLKNIKKNALKNGVRSELLDSKEIKSREPNITAKYALHFKESGIFDSHSFMKSLESGLLSSGVNIVYKNEVTYIKQLPEGGYVIEFKDSKNYSYSITASVVVNCGGLNSYNISRMLGIDNSRYQLSFWKGEYFWLSNNSNTEVNSLIYPMPEKNIAGLGIHTTLDMGGRMKLGPNAIYLGEDNNFDYSVDVEHKKEFFESAKKYLPELKYENLNVDQAGIRPKLQKPGNAFRDFVIKNESDRGFDNFINLIGIESPGLTSSLGIGQYVAGIIKSD